MKMMNTLFSIFLGLSILSCSKADDSKLGVSIIGESAYLIQSTAQTCTNKLGVYLDSANTAVSSTVASRYFSYSGATFSWANTSNTAHIVFMKIEYSSTNLSYSCTISGEELLAIFYDYDNNQAWDGTLTPASAESAPTTISSQCPIRCGGVSVVDENKLFTTSGKITLVGFERNPTTGEEIPLKASTTVKLIYQ